jgi:L-asparagine transporter-like permease
VEWLLFIFLNVAALVLVAVLVVWLRFRVEEAPRLSPWFPALGLVLAGVLGVAAIAAGVVLVAAASALNVVVLAMLFWNARRLRTP